MKINKKTIYIILSIIVLFIFHLSVRYIFNEIYLDKYYNNVHDSKIVDVLKIFNFPESYVAYYNKGNDYYHQKEFKKAINDYNKALKTVPKKKECLVRTNLSLASLEIINYDDFNNLKDELKKVQSILLVNDCARSDGKGKDSSSQKLYDKIEELLNQEGNGDDPDNKDDPDDPSEPQEPDNPQDPENIQEIEEQIRRQQEQGINEREKDRYREIPDTSGKRKW